MCYTWEKMANDVGLNDIYNAGLYFGYPSATVIRKIAKAFARLHGLQIQQVYNLQSYSSVADLRAQGSLTGIRKALLEDIDR